MMIATTPMSTILFNDHNIGRRRERTGCCSTRSRNHHSNHATICIQEFRHQSFLRRRNDSNSLEMIEEEEQVEQQQRPKENDDDDDDDESTSTATTVSTSSSSSSFSPTATTILTATEFYLRSQRNVKKRHIHFRRHLSTV